MAAQVENATPSSLDLEKNKLATEEESPQRVQEKNSEEKREKNSEENIEKNDQSYHLIVQNPDELVQNPSGAQSSDASVVNPKEGDQNPNVTDGTPNLNPNESEAGEEEEEEEGECGFCLFMKSGGCRDTFVAWEKCVEEGEANKEDIVAKCYKVTSLLKECMDRNSDYYEPVLRAERAMEEQVAEEMNEQEGGSEATGTSRESVSERTATIEVPYSEENQD